MVLVPMIAQTGAALPSGVVAAVNSITDFLLDYVIALAAVGALSMALIEAAKKLLDARTRFHARRWTQWVQNTQMRATLPPGAHDIDHARAMTELLQLTTGVSRPEAELAARNLLGTGGRITARHAFRPDPAHALFALEIDRMMANVQEAADVALNTPTEYPALYHLMTAGADARDVQAWYRDARDGLANIANTEPSAQQRQAVKDLADRYARLRQIVKRRLDGFQLYTADHWGSWNQAMANLVGIIAMFGILICMRSTGDGVNPTGATIVVMSLLGGILSPVAKDLVSALKRVKNG